LFVRVGPGGIKLRTASCSGDIGLSHSFSIEATLTIMKNPNCYFYIHRNFSILAAGLYPRIILTYLSGRAAVASDIHGVVGHSVTTLPRVKEYSSQSGEKRDQTMLGCL
jgi:hypothetical protein